MTSEQLSPIKGDATTLLEKDVAMYQDLLEKQVGKEKMMMMRDQYQQQEDARNAQRNADKSIFKTEEQTNGLVVVSMNLTKEHLRQ